MHADLYPRLIVIAGALRGAIFALGAAEAFVGRDPANAVCLNDPSVSRRHCLIRGEAGQFKIIDLDSFNGTFVNGVPVNERSLEHGDQIAVGDILLLLLLRESEAEQTAGLVELGGEDLITRSTIRLQRGDAFYLRPEQVATALPAHERVARDLNVLLKISTTVNSLRGAEVLQKRLLELILEVIPAERGSILLTDEAGKEFTSVLGRHRSAGHVGVTEVSRTITSQVLQEGVALLCNDIFRSEVLNGAESLVASQIRSVLCVPLAVSERTLGIIYFDTREASVRFDEGHLQLLTAIAGIAAVALANAERAEALEGENRRLKEEVLLDHRMIGESPQMREVYRYIAKVVRSSDSTVLIRGETGTGKELAAYAIHQNSARKSDPFVTINCATLTETLLESELFGHEKGAFTGAVAQKKGKLELADGGTVFLDEVGELPPVIQAKLLRVLQAREFERVGGTRPIKINVRVVAATNRDLEKSIRDGGFRQDLYYRLNVISFAMPPLRTRREDISLLANHFAVKYSQKVKRRISGLSPEARACLMAYDWPGNVRELENAVEHAVVLGTTELIMPEDLPEAIVEHGGLAPMRRHMKYYEAVNETKKQLLLDALDRTGGNYTEAAKILGVHPNNLHRLIRNMGLRPPQRD
jgi:transcriptional regulator with GAF, ATPase, and Fis domain